MMTISIKGQEITEASALVGLLLAIALMYLEETAYFQTEATKVNIIPTSSQNTILYTRKNI